MDKKKQLKKIVLLHSNDLHAQILSKDENQKDVGGMALLSGYIRKVRAEEENVIYVIAGDMMNGSVMDSEYNGLSTMMMMNRLDPDVVCVGNHEIDYGISHTLFIEKASDFPIINANIYIKYLDKRLYRPYAIVKRGGIVFGFVGLITKEVASALAVDGKIGDYIEVRDPVEEAELIQSKSTAIKINLAFLVTHIGIEEDRKLAERLGIDSGYSAIIGGHSHTFMDEPEEVKGITIVQAGCGTGQIGRFDIYYDPETLEVDHYDWNLIPITTETCEPDEEMASYIRFLKEDVDLKYQRKICRLNHGAENGSRQRQTELGSLLSDALRNACGLDVFLISTGNIRGEYMDQNVVYESLVDAIPYENQIFSLRVNGKQLKEMLEYSLNQVDFDACAGSIFQISAGIELCYSKEEKKLLYCRYCGKETEETDIFNIGMAEYSYRNLQRKFGIRPEEVEQYGKPKRIAVSDREVLSDYLTTEKYLEVPCDKRIIIV